jgi:hypothetical protein
MQQTITVPASKAKKGDLIVSVDSGEIVGRVDFFDHEERALRTFLGGHLRWSWHESRGLRAQEPTLPVAEALRRHLPEARLGRMLEIQRGIR